MSDVFASKEIPALKTSGLVLAMVLCASLLSACDCDGDCSVGTSATTGSSTTTTTGTTTGSTTVTTPTVAKCADLRFCKYDSTGTMLDDSATSWSCVNDKLLGTFWEVKTTEGLRNKTWTYAKDPNVGACGATVAGCTPDAYVAAVNASTTKPCGAAAPVCRLPTHAELIFLSYPAAYFPTHGKFTPATDTTYAPPVKFFPDQMADGYYYNSTDDRQVNYSAVIPANSSVDAISLLGMAPSLGNNIAGHIRLICQ